jgi:hypothetical protein
MWIRTALSAGLIAAMVCSACGDSPSTPTPTPPPVVIGPTVLGITPATGPTAGGTEVTISGVNFAADASVTIGGATATNIRVVSSSSILAMTAAHQAGPADVTVTVAGVASTLSSAFTFVTLPPPTISSIVPASGSTEGGTTVTITGTNFAVGATVTIGGVAATGVTFVNSTTLQAITGVHAAGAVDVVVTATGQSATLSGRYAYVTAPQNTLPKITGISVQGTRPNEPANFADLNEEVVVTATVTDAETPISQLTFEWTADLGTFAGAGTAVRWRAPATATTPRAVTLTLRVTEVIGAQGPTAVTQSVTATATLSLHNSLKEVGDMSRQFLLDFSDSTLAPSNVVRDFYDGCPGKADELADVTKNRKDFVILSSTIGPADPVSVGFNAGCVVPKYGTRAGDGCAVVQCEWHDKELSTGLLGTTKGPDYLTAVYRNNRWWLCNSDFPSGSHTSPLTGATFIR